VNLVGKKSERPLAIRAEGEREFPFSEKDYAYLAEVVYGRSGIVLGANKVNMVYSRLVRRLRELKLRSFRDYCELLRGDDGDQEIGSMINAITTNLTKFFRENHHFEHLRSRVVPDIEATGIRKLRIWSAGCSSGEEPYSIAMTIAEAIPNLAKWDARILATDLDTKMVATGEAGIYPSAAVTELPRAAQGNFAPAAGRPEHQQVIDPLRRLITFKHLNLLGPWPMKGPFDAIFCRNVMIYFDGPTKQALVQRYATMLKPEGWLYIGHSESLLDAQSSFKLSGRTIYRKLPE
jgi:chemotaxis protein methyltransferase CheR